MIATTWGTGQVLLDVLWFFLFIVELWLMISIFIDLFRRHDMKGWMKALWVFLIIVIPLLGILLYLIFYGDEMRVHALQAQALQDRALGSQGRDGGGPYSPASELMHLNELRERGVITDDEFERLKSKIING